VRVDWQSSAGLLEKIILHEAVHQIDGWQDLRRRLRPDRRCFAFFHPMLPDEPLIFVEVALLPEMPAAVAPLIDREGAVNEDTRRFRVAAFYSISNCQPGLKGVNLGNFLIKRVAERLKAEFPDLKTFCTLSPIPSFADWLSKAEHIQDERLKVSQAERLNAQLKEAKLKIAQDNAGIALNQKNLSKALEALCAYYLWQTSFNEQRHSDPVARFHLNNGAKLERINLQADLSKKGLKQSHGLMVNYLYDLDEIENNHQGFVHEEVSTSSSVLKLM
jgi:malonyl-CoA decarboxylase